MNLLYGRSKGWTFLFCGFVFIFTAQALFAGGTIKGVIYDKDTNETLPAANVVLQGTSLGTAGYLDGTYILQNVPPGMYTIVVTFMGYEKVTDDVMVQDGMTVEKNFELRSVAVQGEQVVITAQALGQVEAINQQLSSNTITNVVSKARIHELPDDNAATALSRLPGISLQDGDKVVIRGVEAKLNTVLIVLGPVFSH